MSELKIKRRNEHNGQFTNGYSSTDLLGRFLVSCSVASVFWCSVRMHAPFSIQTADPSKYAISVPLCCLLLVLFGYHHMLCRGGVGTSTEK